MAPKEYLKAEHRRIYRISGQLELLSEIYKYKYPPASILDYGCGRGYFLDEARRHGYKVAGIEISRSAKYYCQNIGIPVYSTMKEVDSLFDVILLYNSLVKAPDPLKAMKNIKEKLTKNGFVIIKVPYTKSKFWKLFQTGEEQFFKQVYLQHFTLKSMKLLLEKSGYEIIDIRIKKSKNKFNRRLLYFSSSLFKKFFDLKIPLSEKFRRMLFNTFRKEISVVAKIKS